MDSNPSPNQDSFSQADSNQSESVDLNEWPEELALDPESQQRVQQKWQQVRCYGFTISTLNLIAPLNVYCELLTQFRIEPVPNSPQHFLGLTNVRGNLVPIYQLEPLVGADNIGQKYALVIGKLERAAALIVGSKPKQFNLQNFQVDEAPDKLHPLVQSCIVEHYRHNNEQWCLINHNSLFDQLAKISSISVGEQSNIEQTKGSK